MAIESNSLINQIESNQSPSVTVQQETFDQQLETIQSNYLGKSHGRTMAVPEVMPNIPEPYIERLRRGATWGEGNDYKEFENIMLEKYEIDSEAYKNGIETVKRLGIPESLEALLKDAQKWGDSWGILPDSENPMPKNTPIIITRYGSNGLSRVRERQSEVHLRVDKNGNIPFSRNPDGTLATEEQREGHLILLAQHEEMHNIIRPLNRKLNIDFDSDGYENESVVRWAQSIYDPRNLENYRFLKNKFPQEIDNFLPEDGKIEDLPKYLNSYLKSIQAKPEINSLEDVINL
jgi:hypothetical protein